MMPRDSLPSRPTTAIPPPARSHSKSPARDHRRYAPASPPLQPQLQPRRSPSPSGGLVREASVADAGDEIEEFHTAPQYHIHAHVHHPPHRPATAASATGSVRSTRPVRPSPLAATAVLAPASPDRRSEAESPQEQQQLVPVTGKLPGSWPALSAPQPAHTRPYDDGDGASPFISATDSEPSNIGPEPRESTASWSSEARAESQLGKLVARRTVRTTRVITTKVDRRVLQQQASNSSMASGSAMAGTPLATASAISFATTDSYASFADAAGDAQRFEEEEATEITLPPVSSSMPLSESSAGTVLQVSDLGITASRPSTAETVAAPNVYEPAQPAPAAVRRAVPRILISRPTATDSLASIESINPSETDLVRLAKLLESSPPSLGSEAPTIATDGAICVAANASPPPPLPLPVPPSPVPAARRAAVHATTYENEVSVRVEERHTLLQHDEMVQQQRYRRSPSPPPRPQQRQQPAEPIIPMPQPTPFIPPRSASLLGPATLDSNLSMSYAQSSAFFDHDESYHHHQQQQQQQQQHDYSLYQSQHGFAAIGSASAHSLHTVVSTLGFEPSYSLDPSALDPVAETATLELEPPAVGPAVAIVQGSPPPHAHALPPAARVIVVGPRTSSANQPVHPPPPLPPPVQHSYATASGSVAAAAYHASVPAGFGEVLVSAIPSQDSHHPHQRHSTMPPAQMFHRPPPPLSPPRRAHSRPVPSTAAAAPVSSPPPRSPVRVATHTAGKTTTTTTTTSVTTAAAVAATTTTATASLLVAPKPLPRLSSLLNEYPPSSSALSVSDDEGCAGHAHDHARVSFDPLTSTSAIAGAGLGPPSRSPSLSPPRRRRTVSIDLAPPVVHHHVSGPCDVSGRVHAYQHLAAAVDGGRGGAGFHDVVEVEDADGVEQRYHHQYGNHGRGYHDVQPAPPSSTALVLPGGGGGGGDSPMKPSRKERPASVISLSFTGCWSQVRRALILLNLVRSVITTFLAMYTTITTLPDLVEPFDAAGFYAASVIFAVLDLVVAVVRALPRGWLLSRGCCPSQPESGCCRVPHSWLNGDRANVNTLSIWGLVAGMDLVLHVVPLLANSVLKLYHLRLIELSASPHLDRVIGTTGFSASVTSLTAPAAQLAIFVMSLYIAIAGHTYGIVHTLVARKRAWKLAGMVVAKAVLFTFDITVLGVVLYQLLILKGPDLFDLSDAAVRLALSIVAVAPVANLASNAAINYPLHYYHIRMALKGRVFILDDDRRSGQVASIASSHESSVLVQTVDGGTAVIGTGRHVSKRRIQRAAMRKTLQPVAVAVFGTFTLYAAIVLASMIAPVTSTSPFAFLVSFFFPGVGTPAGAVAVPLPPAPPATAGVGGGGGAVTSVFSTSTTWATSTVFVSNGMTWTVATTWTSWTSAGVVISTAGSAWTTNTIPTTTTTLVPAPTAALTQGTLVGATPTTAPWTLVEVPKPTAAPTASSANPTTLVVTSAGPNGAVSTLTVTGFVAPTPAPVPAQPSDAGAGIYPPLGLGGRLDLAVHATLFLVPVTSTAPSGTVVTATSTLAFASQERPAPVPVAGPSTPKAGWEAMVDRISAQFKEFTEEFNSPARRRRYVALIVANLVLNYLAGSLVAVGYWCWILAIGLGLLRIVDWVKRGYHRVRHGAHPHSGGDHHHHLHDVERGGRVPSPTRLPLPVVMPADCAHEHETHVPRGPSPARTARTLVGSTAATDHHHAQSAATSAVLAKLVGQHSGDGDGRPLEYAAFDPHHPLPTRPARRESSLYDAATAVNSPLLAPDPAGGGDWAAANDYSQVPRRASVPPQPQLRLAPLVADSHVSEDAWADAEDNVEVGRPLTMLVVPPPDEDEGERARGRTRSKSADRDRDRETHHHHYHHYIHHHHHACGSGDGSVSPSRTPSPHVRSRSASPTLGCRPHVHVQCSGSGGVQPRSRRGSASPPKLRAGDGLLDAVLGDTAGDGSKRSSTWSLQSPTPRLAAASSALRAAVAQDALLRLFWLITVFGGRRTIPRPVHWHGTNWDDSGAPPRAVTALGPRLFHRLQAHQAAVNPDVNFVDAFRDEQNYDGDDDDDEEGEGIDPSRCLVVFGDPPSPVAEINYGRLVLDDAFVSALAASPDTRPRPRAPLAVALYDEILFTQLRPDPRPWSELLTLVHLAEFRVLTNDGRAVAHLLAEVHRHHPSILEESVPVEYWAQLSLERRVFVVSRLHSWAGWTGHGSRRTLTEFLAVMAVLAWNGDALAALVSDPKYGIRGSDFIRRAVGTGITSSVLGAVSIAHASHADILRVLATLNALGWMQWYPRDKRPVVCNHVLGVGSAALFFAVFDLCDAEYVKTFSRESRLEWGRSLLPRFWHRAHRRNLE
ncbi:hypothetical protein H9P43_008801 [Blastocladiella emersonii ATCC 22665]|nr:hypothetical protein H9P43_008801 [Blastocladiella emersonii ATCC 22665]